LLKHTLQPLSGRTIGVLGPCLQGGHQRAARSPSIELIQALLKDGARVQAFDPHVSSLPDDQKPVQLCADTRAAAAGADALGCMLRGPSGRTYFGLKFSGATASS
jgi:UDPglucose 6-dehydrogenase